MDKFIVVGKCFNRMTNGMPVIKERSDTFFFFILCGDIGFNAAACFYDIGNSLIIKFNSFINV